MSPEAPFSSSPPPAPGYAAGDEAAVLKAILHDEAFIHQLLESATDCLAVLDLEGRLLSLNEGGRKAWEIGDPAPYLHRSWIDWWPGDGRALASRAVAEAVAGSTGRFVAAAPTAAGATKWWDVSVTPVPGPAGRPARLLAAARDITAQKLASDRLAESQGRFEAAFSQSLVGMSIIDPEGRVLEINDAFCRMVGRSREEIVGRTSHDYTHLEDHELTARIVGDALRGSGARSVVEKRYLHKDGTVVWARLSLSSAQRDARGNSLRLVGVIENITASKLAHETIRSSEAWLRQVFESIADYAIFTLDPDGLVTGWNSGAQRLFGYVESEIVGRDSALLWLDADRAAGIPAKERRDARELGRGHEEGWRQRRDGSRFFVSGVLTPIRNPGGDLIGFTKVCRDVTTQRQTEQALSAARARLDSALSAGEVATYVWEIAADRLYGDANFERMFNVTLAEDGSAPLEAYLAAIHAEDRPRVADLIRETVATGRDFEAEYRITKPGGERWVISRGKIEGRGRQTPRFVGVILDVTARKRAEEAQQATAREYERQSRIFNTVLSSSADSAYLIDREGRFLYANRRLLEIFGRQLEDLVGKNFHELDYEPWHAEKHMREVAQVFATRTRVVDEIPYRGPTGIYGVYEYIFEPVLGPDGEVEVIVGTTHDITESRRAREALEASEGRSRFLNELGEQTRWLDEPDAIMSATVRLLGTHLRVSRCIYANVDGEADHCTVRQDYTADCPSFVGQYKLKDFGPRVAAELRDGKTLVLHDAENDLADGGGAETFRAAGIRALVCCPLIKQGRLVALMAVHQAEPRRWLNAEVELVQAVAERSWSTIERTQSALALRRRERQLSFIIGAARLGTFDWELPVGPGKMNWNERMKAFFWLPPDAVPPTLETKVHPDDWARVRLALDQAINGDSLYDVEYRIVGPEGQLRWVHASGQSYEDGSGEAKHFSGVVADITQARLAAEERERLLESERAARTEAERTSRMKDEFLATLSHELRTPLNAILGWAQVLRSEPPGPADLEQGLATIERNARAQTQIIEDLLDMSRIISGKVRLDIMRIDLVAVLEQAVETVRPAAAARGIRLQPVLDRRVGPVSGDPNRLQQVFWNLFNNAIKFTPRHGRVQIVLERVNSHLEISVIDSGEGIASEFLPYVFDRFRQQDASTTRRHGGLGLGLAIVKQLVELHGGSVTAHSDGPGQGATFRVSLPLVVFQPDSGEPRRHPQAQFAPLTAPDASIRLDGVTVLVVDDEPDARGLVKRLLQDRKARVLTAGQAAEALTILQNERPDVLVSDIGMPGEDGYTLIRQVRALDPQAGGLTPALALTAYARSEDRMKAILAGFQMHVSKPVEAAELLTMVASLAGKT